MGNDPNDIAAWKEADEFSQKHREFEDALKSTKNGIRAMFAVLQSVQHHYDAYDAEKYSMATSFSALIEDVLGNLSWLDLDELADEYLAVKEVA